MRADKWTDPEKTITIQPFHLTPLSYQDITEETANYRLFIDGLRSRIAASLGVPLDVLQSPKRPG